MHGQKNFEARDNLLNDLNSIFMISDSIKIATQNTDFDFLWDFFRKK